MKVAYCGIDILVDCLAVLQECNADIVKIFTYSTDVFDSTEAVSAFAISNGIPLETKPINSNDIEELAALGVELLVVAGYAAKIPTTDKFMQVNIHPALLPEGRGPWPMPVNILHGISSGITIHKLSDKMDEGDILLSCEIPLEENENLQTLTEKVQKKAALMLSRFLAQPSKLWQNAVKQVGGSYWSEPDDNERTLNSSVPLSDAERIMRAFYGYGVLYEHNGVLMEISFGTVVEKKCNAEYVYLPVNGGWLQVESWHPYFRQVHLSDKKELERIRHTYPSQLSDYTFAMLYCWQKTMNLQIYLYKDMYAVRAKNYWFCPVGEPEQCYAFLETVRKLYGKLTLRFCDSAAQQFLSARYGDLAVSVPSDNDGDYVIPIEVLESFPGGKLHKRRIEYHHYRDLIPPPVVTPVTKDNVHIVKELLVDNDRYDSEAANIGVRNYAELGLQGILVSRGERYVGFIFTSQQYEGIRQAHFCRCMDEERGAMLYLIRAAALHGGECSLLNLEDDMGINGLRMFKQSLHGEFVTSYTVEIG